MAGLRRTGSLLVIALMPWVLTGCASTSSRLAKLHTRSAESQEQTWTRAQLFEHEGRYAEAQQLYVELCRLDPKSPLYAHRLGVVSTMLSDHERAYAAYQRAKALDPNNPELLADMGYSAYLQKDHAQAESLLRACLATVPDHPRAKSNLALAVGCQGRYDECLALFREVHGQDEAEVLCNLAYVKSQRGEVVEAAALYKQVLAIDPKFVKAATALAQLRSSDVPGQTVAQQKPYHKYMNQSVEGASGVSKPPVKPASIENVASQIPTTEAVDSSVVQTADQVVQISPHEAVEEQDPAPWSDAEPDLTISSSPSQQRQFPVEHPIATQVVPVAPAAPSVGTKTVATDQGVTAVENTPAEIPAPNDSAAKAEAEEPRELTDGWAAAEASVVEQFGPEWLDAREEQLKARTGQSGFMGFCPVALRDELKLVDALPQYSAEHQSTKFQFGSEEALQKFVAKPERYLPAAGGLDVVAVSQGTAVAQGSLEHAMWFRKKLYLFFSRENMELFRTQARDFAVQD